MRQDIVLPMVVVVDVCDYVVVVGLVSYFLERKKGDVGDNGVQGSKVVR